MVSSFILQLHPTTMNLSFDSRMWRVSHQKDVLSFTVSYLSQYKKERFQLKIKKSIVCAIFLTFVDLNFTLFKGQNLYITGPSGKKPKTREKLVRLYDITCTWMKMWWYAPLCVYVCVCVCRLWKEHHSENFEWNLYLFYG
jgi:hypothetical protein